MIGTGRMVRWGAGGLVWAGLLGLGLDAGLPAQTGREAPGVVAQGAEAYSFSVGEVRVTALSDGTVPQDLHTLLRGSSADRTDALLHTAFLTNPIEASINAFLVQLEGRLVLVDTGSGDFFGAGFGGRLVESLAAVGVRPEQITDVLLTHAHDDHMGGLVHKGQIAFPQATVHLSQADLDFFLHRENAAKAHYDASYFEQAEIALRPYVNAGKVQPFAAHAEVVPGLTADVHAGHTPGSTFYTLKSGGQRMVFVGDLVHAAAVQFPEPAVTIVYDVDAAKAAGGREEAFARFARERTLIAVPHLPFPGVGHVRAEGSGYAWVPVVFGNRDPAVESDFAHRHGK